MFYANKSDKNKNVKAVINIVESIDLNDPGFKNYDEYSFVEKHLIDPKIVDKNISLMDFGSPVHWIGKSSPPALSFYGLHDTVVPLSQKKILDSVLKKILSIMNLMNSMEIIFHGKKKATQNF
ncbi:hypothetical protein [Chryseobacterium wanjuense]